MQENGTSLMLPIGRQTRSTQELRDYVLTEAVPEPVAAE